MPVLLEKADLTGTTLEPTKLRTKPTPVVALRNSDIQAAGWCSLEVVFRSAKVRMVVEELVFCPYL